MPNFPLILTLALDDRSFARANEMRQQFFPSALNIVPAHITLFHYLPGLEIAAISNELRQQCGNITPFELRVTGLRNLGRGVAYLIDAEVLLGLRRRLAQSFSLFLTKQDQQKYKPHLTVQNKVTPDEARMLFRQLETQFAPFTMKGVGLHLWRYLNGPWERVQTFPFAETVGKA